MQNMCAFVIKTSQIKSFSTKNFVNNLTKHINNGNVRLSDDAYQNIVTFYFFIFVHSISLPRNKTYRCNNEGTRVCKRAKQINTY